MDELLVQKAVPNAVIKEGGPDEAGHLPHIPAFLRYTFAQSWLRYTDGTGATGA